MKKVDETIETICNWIQTELENQSSKSINNLPEMISALAGLAAVNKPDAGTGDNGIIIHGVSITPEELETIELHQENISRALSDIKGIMRDDDGMLRIKYAGTGWWNYKYEEWR